MKKILLTVLLLVIFYGLAFSQISVTTEDEFRSAMDSSSSVNIEVSSGISFTGDIGSSYGKSIQIVVNNGSFLSASTDSVKGFEITNTAFTLTAGGTSTAVEGFNGAIEAFNSDIFLSGGLSLSGNRSTALQGSALVMQNSNLYAGRVSFSDNGSSGMDTGSGAVYAQGSSAVFNGIVVFSSNSVMPGSGGALNLDNSSFDFSNAGESYFFGNTAWNKGGAVYSYESTILFGGKTVFDGNNADDNGGAAYIERSITDFSASSETFFTNNSATGSGGALYLEVSTSVFGGDISFENNSADYGLGGAVFAENSYIRLTSATTAGFESNTSAGGGAAAFDRSYAYFGGSVSFKDNEAVQALSYDGKGGALNSRNSNIDFSKTSSLDFSGNRSFSDGGAAYFSGSSVYFGGAVTVSSNTSSSGSGGGLYLTNSGIDLSAAAGSVFSENTAYGSGGAVDVSSGSSAFFGSNVIFTSNTAVSGSGGAVSADLSLINMSTASFSYNTAQSSGGAVTLVNGSSGYFSNETEFDGNISRSGKGGAVFADNSRADFINATNLMFSGNEAYGSGGALALTGGSVSSFAGDISFENNRSSAGFGGAVYTDSSSVSMINADKICLSGNEAVSGGGMYLASSTATLAREAHFSGNRAFGGFGGAVYADDAKLNFIYSDTMTFTGNTAKDSGGAIYMTTTSADFSYYMVFENNASLEGSGGAVFADDSVIDILYAKQTVFENNSAKDFGGAFALEGSTAEFGLGTIFKDNHSEAGSGGAVSANNSTLDFFYSDETEFINNRAFVSGGAAYLSVSTMAFGGDVLFENNISSGRAGAVYALDSVLDFAYAVSSVFNGNIAAQDGGAVYLSDNSEAVFGGGIKFINNISSGSGGAVYADNSNAVFVFPSSKENVFSGNTAVSGGAVFLTNKSTAVFAGEALFAGNTASDSGGAFYIESSSITIADILLENNSAANSGGAVYAKGSAGTLAEVLLIAETREFSASGNTAGGSANDIYLGGHSLLKLNALNYDINLEGGILTADSADIHIYKEGKHAANLGGTNYIGGTISIEEGILNITDGSSFNGNSLNIGENGMLKGSGIRNMEFDNTAIAGKWMVSVSTYTGSDKIISGAVNLNNAKLGVSGKLGTGTDFYTIIESSAVTGNFVSEIIAQSVRTTLETGIFDSSVTLRVTSIDFADIKGLNKNEKTVLKIIDGVYDESYNRQDEIWTDIITLMNNITSKPRIKAAADQLSGSFIANALTVSAFNKWNSIVFNHIYDEENENIWGDISGGMLKYDSDNVSASFENMYLGLSAGADIIRKDGITGGLFVNYGFNDIKQGEDTGSVNDFGLGGYLGIYKWKTSLEGGLRLGYQRYETERKFEAFNNGLKAEGDFGGYGIAADIKAKYAFDIYENVKLNPFAALSFGFTSNESYKESGSVAALKVDGGNYFRSSFDLGAEIEGRINKFTLCADLGAGFLIAGGKNEIKAVFIGNNIETESTEQGTVSLKTGINGKYDINESFKGYLGAVYSLSSGYTDVYCNISFGYTFR